MSDDLVNRKDKKEKKGKKEMGNSESSRSDIGVCRTRKMKLQAF